MPDEIDTTKSEYISPITPRAREFFYSSIPVDWLDPEDCVACLPCVRDTQEPQTQFVTTNTEQ